MTRHFTSETAREAGRKGGRALVAKRGTPFYQEIGKKGGTLTAQRGPEYFRAIGRARGQFTPDDVRLIRALVAAGTRRTEVAADYGVSVSTIGCIVTGHTYGYVA